MNVPRKRRFPYRPFPRPSVQLIGNTTYPVTTSTVTSSSLLLYDFRRGAGSKETPQ